MKNVRRFLFIFDRNLFNTFRKCVRKILTAACYLWYNIIIIKEVSFGHSSKDYGISINIGDRIILL